MTTVVLSSNNLKQAAIEQLTSSQNTGPLFTRLKYLNTKKGIVMIELLTARTPNGHKVSIALEELGLAYDVKKINMRAGEQKENWFLKLNPNGRIPVIVDRDEKDFVVFESGAILIYLAEKTGKLLPEDAKGRSIVLQWLMFQMGGIGPMMGQANVFYRYFEEKIEAAISRYQNECYRLFGVLDNHTKHHEWLAGDYSIADIANWAWVRSCEWSGLSMSKYPHLQRWHERMAARPACKRGIEVPEATKATPDRDRLKTARSIVIK